MWAYTFNLMLILVMIRWCFPVEIYCDFLLCTFSLCRLCVKKLDQRAQAEAKAQTVIDEDYQKLGPLKWGHLVQTPVQCFRCTVDHNSDLYFPFSILVLQRDPSCSFLFCLAFSCSQEIPSLSLAGLCFSPKGKCPPAATTPEAALIHCFQECGAVFFTNHVPL